MKKLGLILLCLGVMTIAHSQDKPKDNQELIEIYKNDQADRQTDNIDWNVVTKRDNSREVRIYELLDSNKVQTSKDYHNAAMIFQHGGDSTAYGMAVKLTRKSIELDSTANKWLLAAAIDRHLLSKGEPQIYGTQYQKKNGEGELWFLREIDTTKISDTERIEYGVETLAQQRERVKLMNREKLSELIAQGKSIDDVINVITSEDKKDSKFDISESGINGFGYNLLGQGKTKEALKIFKLNTELYPNGSNTYDSYGECLFLLGDKEEGLKAYKKSLELNPKNKNAETIIEQNK
jgi:tetratricopeptide (TPR) repeat protein